MLTSFFGKSKPVHFLILGAFLAFGFVWTLFIDSQELISSSALLKNALLLIVTVLSIILLDFIVSKNHLTHRNAYAIFFYACFMIMLPVIFLSSEVVWANVFLLLALRRIISLRKDSNSEKKILDTAIWTTVASLFYFWSLLFFVPLWIAIIQKPNLTYKQMLIPIVGFFAVLLTNSAYQVLLHGSSLDWFLDWQQPIDLDFSSYNSMKILIPVTLVLTFLIFMWFHSLKRLASVSLKEKSHYMIFFIVIATTLTIALCGAEKDGSELIFLFAPTAILCANYVEGRDKPSYVKIDNVEYWFKEILLWVVALSAFIFLLIWP